MQRILFLYFRQKTINSYYKPLYSFMFKVLPPQLNYLGTLLKKVFRVFLLYIPSYFLVNQSFTNEFNDLSINMYKLLTTIL